MTLIGASRLPKFGHELDLLAAVAIPGRECGSCTLCCNLLAVLFIDRLAGQWCQHSALHLVLRKKSLQRPLPGFDLAGGDHRLGAAVDAELL